MKLRFHGYKIVKLNYEHGTSKNNEKENIQLHIGKSGIAFNKKIKIADIIVDSTVEVKKENSSKPYRKLDSTIVFAFDIVEEEEMDVTEEQVIPLMKDRGFNVALSMLKDIIKNISSIDYSKSIDARAIDIPIDVINLKKVNKDSKK